MRFFMTFGFLALIILQSGCLPIHTLSDLSSSQDSSLAAALIQRVKKDSDMIEYLDECSTVDSWQEKPGFINVLAFLDASWGYSHSQATMLKMLQDRLERSGITGVKFFVINSSKPEAALNSVDVEEEKEAWDAAEFDDNRVLSEIEKTREELKKKIDPDISFIQDSDELKIWEKLSASRDQVLVIDKCGRLSYRVIVPWSILHFPYVKAAILSTYKEQPCGGCDLESTTVTHGTESQTETLSELVPDNLNIDKMKEIVVKKYNLDQTDNTVRKVHHGTKSKDIPENVIQLLNGTANVKQEKSNPDFNNGTKHGSLMSTEASIFNESYVKAEYSQAQNLTEDNIDDNKEENLLVIEDTLNVNKNMKSQNDSNSSSTIVTESMDILESTTVHIIEEQSSNASEQMDYLADNHEAYNSGFVEWTSSKNTSKYYEEEENLDTNSNSEASNQSGNDYIDNNSSVSEASENSSSSSGEQTDNHIKKTTPISGESNADEQSESYDYVMPIRMIMHAPHIHKSEETMKKYEYLVLKFGSPEYHGHLEYDDDFVSNEKDQERFESGYDRSHQNEGVTSEENDEAEFGSGEVGRDEHGKKHRHPGNTHDHKSHRHSKSKHLDIVYGKDESPGFYGEDAEYWRNSGNGDYSNQLQIELPANMTEPGKDNETETEGNIALNITETSNNDTIIEEGTVRYPDSETNLEYHTSGKILQGTEFSGDKNYSYNEEIENKLLLHYSKLLPWLDYIID